jgi:5-methylcytosine-specific restriction endonuclease McrA
MGDGESGVTQRSTTVRDQHRAVIRRGKPPCALCEQPIDYTLHYLDPMAYVVDHIVPLAKGGVDDLANKQAAHRSCNRTKSDKLAEDMGPRTFVTSRTW